LWVFDELAFDKFLSKSDQLYQVWINATYDGKVNSWTSLPLPTYEALKTQNSNIKNTCVTDWGGDHLLSAGDKRIYKRAFYASVEFLEMFEFPLVKGNAAQVLDDPSSIVITESLAKALFGDADPMGKNVRFDNSQNMTVTGVIRDVPANATLQFNYLVPFAYSEATQGWIKDGRTKWTYNSFSAYVALEPGVQPSPAMARKVDDSGEGTCYLVYGGRWGLRLKDPRCQDPWSLDDPHQWGEAFLLLSADGADVRFQTANPADLLS